MRSCVAFLFGLAALASHIASAAGDDLGVVLLHGKGGSPAGYIRELASALQSRGYLVSTPTMPWAKNRIYDASFEEAMAEIDREVNALRQKGAKLVVVAGQSLGANAALGYAASREGVGGIIALAPAHNPEMQVFARRVGPDVRRARAMVAAGEGNEKQAFPDLNQGQVLKVSATAEVYLSWFDPDGPAVMPRSAASITKRQSPRQKQIRDRHRGPFHGTDGRDRRGRQLAVRITAVNRHGQLPLAEALHSWRRKHLRASSNSYSGLGMMNTPRAQAIAASLALALSSAHAGDLATLPKDDAGFRQKVSTFIRAGARVADAQKLLESDRFRCQEGRDAEGSFLWCGRSDGSPMASVQQRYQVILRTSGAAVTSVKTSTSLVGP